MKEAIVLPTTAPYSVLPFYSETPDTFWNRTYVESFDNRGNSVVQGSDGPFIVVFALNFYADPSGKLWLLHIDAQGGLNRNKIYGGTDS